MKPIFVKLCALLFCILSPIHALANPSLDALENMAKSYLDDDKPELALNIYQQYQSLLETQNYNRASCAARVWNTPPHYGPHISPCAPLFP